MPLPRHSLVAVLALATGLGTMSPSPAEASDQRRPPQITQQMVDGGFLSGHPDLRWRREAMFSMGAERPSDAFAQFQRAARYADKPSAAMVAEMYWTGLGVPQDRALGYVWMDLAAERLWRPFLAKREAYWAELTAEERARALAIGAAVYDEYGDAVAKERKEKAMNRAKRQITGSRVGYVGSMSIVTASGSISGDEFYNPTFWRAERYWAWQDDTWRDARPGTVSVGPVRDGGEATPPRDESERRPR